MTLRTLAKKTGLSAATLCRVGQDKPLSQENLLKVLRVLDKELEHEVSCALAYLRASINRRSRKP